MSFTTKEIMDGIQLILVLLLSLYFYSPIIMSDFEKAKKRLLVLTKGYFAIFFLLTVIEFFTLDFNSFLKNTTQKTIHQFFGSIGVVTCAQFVLTKANNLIKGEKA